MSKPHRWALLDKKGKNRGTCEAKNYADAKGNFLSKRRSPIPKGWRIVDRGPVEDDTLALAADPTPEPRAFKVGDEVECTKGGNPWWRPGDRATLTKQDHDGDWIGLVHRTNYQTWVHESDKRGGWHNTCRLVPAAPQPKAEEGKRLTTVDLAEKFTNELGEALGERTPWSDMVARVATLKSEVERLTTERDDAREEMTENYKNYRAADDRAQRLKLTGPAAAKTTRREP